jgi:NRPS condensation-like uncharacterized protein
MYQWGELYPYNAVHIYRIAGPLGLDRLCRAVRDTFRDNGIGMIEVGAEGRSFQHKVDDSPEIEVLDNGEDRESRLAAHVTRELNRPFARPKYRPLRLSVIDGPNAHDLLVTYDHWIADSVAARLILRHILGRYLATGTPVDLKPLDLYPGTYRDAFASRLGKTRLASAALRCLGHLAWDRPARQVAYSSTAQMAVTFELYRTATGTVDGLRDFARRQGATVHDVILAALGRAMARVLPRRSSRHGSQDLALGSIVDTRNDADYDLAGSLGAFLSYYLVRCRPDNGTGLADFTRQIVAITRPLKAQRGYLDSLVNVKVLSGILPHLGQSARPHFLRKILPLTAGVSNVYLREGWMDPVAEGRIQDYARAVSTGPSLPLVIGPTTVGGRMNIGLSYRSTGFTRAKIEGLMQAFLDDIENPGSAAGRSRFARREGVVLQQSIVPDRATVTGTAS